MNWHVTHVTQHHGFSSHDANTRLRVLGMQTPVKGTIRAFHAFAVICYLIGSSSDHSKHLRVGNASLLNSYTMQANTQSTYPRPSASRYQRVLLGLAHRSTQDSTLALQAATTSGVSSFTVQQSQLQPKWGYGSGPGQAVRAQQS